MSRRPDVTAFGHLAAAMAHEVRNPLNAIAIHADLVETRARRAGGAEAEGLRKSAQVLLREVERIDGILTAFLDHVGPREPERRAVPVEELLAGVTDRVASVAEPAGVTVRIESDVPARTKWKLDVGAVAHVLDELVTNAVEASAAGATVTIRVRQEDDTAHLVVTNDGALSPDAVSKMFHLGFTTKKGRAGLGLSVAKQIVKAHGGSIQSSSTDGKVTVTVELPLD